MHGEEIPWFVAAFVSAMGVEVKGLFWESARIVQKRLNRDLRDGNPAGHADVDIVFPEPRAVMEIADPMKLAATVLIFEGMRARVEGAEHNFVFRRFICGVGQVDVPESAGSGRPREEFVEGVSGALGGDRPIGAAVLPDVLRDGDR